MLAIGLPCQHSNLSSMPLTLQWHPRTCAAMGQRYRPRQQQPLSFSEQTAVR
jgi:hypothetical protein